MVNNSKDASGGTGTDAANPAGAWESSYAKKFAQIKASDLQASLAFITAHFDVLRDPKTDCLLAEAVAEELHQDNDAQALQYLHQALILKFIEDCDLAGAIRFMNRMASRPQDRESFRTSVNETMRKIRQIHNEKVRETRTEKLLREVEEQYIAQGEKTGERAEMRFGMDIGLLYTRVPRRDAEHEDERKARETFESFSPHMQAALETGSMRWVNRVIGGMSADDAQKVALQLQNASVSPKPNPRLTTALLMLLRVFSFVTNRAALSTIQK
ncbi:hsp90 co-chaperone Cdc37 [Conoideocrella luteorostrata]|uniref:Hsp90 co-chaperone Cdc37 n=1 Tax=Conoideocrella luteorostrata TaxID=1105319 RepID=A0AAJ0CVD8_9HYPO|nr:hsp90 co-chaperone Cdc37 [Conoideocrella luteorostrata]